MLVSPIPNVRESQSELVSGSPHDDIPKDESFEASRSASPDQPLLFSFDEKLNSLSTHIDQNNENEAIAPLVTSFKQDETQHRTTNTETLMHLIKGNIGAGILAFPYALSKAGLVFGTIAFWVMGVMTLYCMHQLLRCHAFYRDRVVREKCDFGDIMRFTMESSRWPLVRRYAKVGKFTIDGFIVLIQLGFCSVYFVFVPASIKQVIDFHTTNHVPIQIYQLVMLFLVIGFSLIRSLKVLAPFSLAANLLSITGLIIIMQYVIRTHMPLNKLPLVTSPSEWPVFFASAMYVFEGIALVLPVRQKMKEPEAYGGLNGVLNTGIYLVTILYFFVGFFGYIRYGSDARGSISLNLPDDQVLYQLTKIMYAIAIFLTYNLQFYVPFTLLWPRINRKFLHNFDDRKKKLCEFGFRVFLISITCSLNLTVVFIRKIANQRYILLFLKSLVGLAAAIPNLGLVISLVGAIASTTLSVIFPPLLETMTFWPNGLGRFKWQLILNSLIMAFGIYVFVAGTTLSLSNIAACIREGERCDD